MNATPPEISLAELEVKARLTGLSHRDLVEVKMAHEFQNLIMCTNESYTELLDFCFKYRTEVYLWATQDNEPVARRWSAFLRATVEVPMMTNMEIEFKLRLIGLPVYQLRRLALLIFRCKADPKCPVCHGEVSKRKFYQHSKPHDFAALLAYIRENREILRHKAHRGPAAKDKKFPVAVVLEKLDTI